MGAADAIEGMAPLVRICAVVAAAIVALSLVLFALDESSTGSENQVRSVEGTAKVQSDADVQQPNPAPAAERERENAHSSAREYVDDANDVIVSPFTGLAGSSDVWVRRLVPGALGLLLYGLGGLMLANWLPASRRESQDWRTAA